jgi:hypothetical protein
MHICWHKVLFSPSIVSLSCPIEFCKLLTPIVNVLYVGQPSSVLLKWQIPRTQTGPTLLFHIYHHSFIL